jgi:ATP/maltotriose-dependent transcriptional regulator MalT
MGRNGDQVLTSRERQVAFLVCDRFTDHEIAERFLNTRLTAEWHMKPVFSKLGVNSPAQRAAGVTHHQAIDSLETRLVGADFPAPDVEEL